MDKPNMNFKRSLYILHTEWWSKCS